MRGTAPPIVVLSLQIRTAGERIEQHFVLVAHVDARLDAVVGELLRMEPIDCLGVFVLVGLQLQEA